MKTCRNCGYDMPDTAKFCGKCKMSFAVPQKKICQNCGSEIPDNYRVCGKCGTAYGVMPTPQYAAPPPPPKPTIEYKFHPLRIAMFAATAVGIISVFLPWSSADFWNNKGTHIEYSDIGFTYVRGIAALLMFIPPAVFGIYGERSKIVKQLFSIIAIALGAIAAITSYSIIAEGEGGDIGVILSTLSGVVITIIGIVSLKKNIDKRKNK